MSRPWTPPTASRLNARTAPVVVLGSGVVLSFSPLIFREASCTAWQYMLFRLLGVWIAATAGLLHAARCGTRGGRARALALVLRRRNTIVAGAMMAVANCAFIIALARVDSATAILFQGFAPLVAAFVGRVVPPQELLDRHTGIASALALCGLALMGTTWGSADGVGLFAAALIPCGLGCYGVVLKRTAEEERDAWAPLFWAGALGALAALLRLAAEPSGFAIAPRDALLGLSAGALILGVGLAIFNVGAPLAGATRATLLINSELVLAPLWTWLVLGETPALRTCLGGALVLLALVWIVTHPSARAASPKLLDPERPAAAPPPASRGKASRAAEGGAGSEARREASTVSSTMPRSDGSGGELARC